VWWDSPNHAPPFLRETFPIYRNGGFCYHFFLSNRFPKPFRRLVTLLFYLRWGLQLHFEKKFDVIMTYGTNRPGIAGVLLKWITGARLIVEIPGVPENAFRYDVPHSGCLDSVKRFFASQFLLLAGITADCIQIIYPLQLQKYPFLHNKKIAVFPPFVPAHVISP